MKIKLRRCKYFEADIDDLSRNYWCHNENCPTRECWADFRTQMIVCPFYKPSDDKGREIDIDSKKLKEEQVQFLKTIKELLDEKFNDSKRLIKSHLERLDQIEFANNKIKELMEKK